MALEAMQNAAKIVISNFSGISCNIQQVHNCCSHLFSYSLRPIPSAAAAAYEDEDEEEERRLVAPLLPSIPKGKRLPDLLPPPPPLWM